VDGIGTGLTQVITNNRNPLWDITHYIVYLMLLKKYGLSRALYFIVFCFCEYHKFCNRVAVCFLMDKN